MKLYAITLAAYLWGACVFWFGCSPAAVDRTVAAIDPYQTCLVASLLSPRTPKLAAQAGMSVEQWSESICRIASGLADVAESIAGSTYPVPNPLAGVAGGPS